MCLVYTLSDLRPRSLSSSELELELELENFLKESTNLLSSSLYIVLFLGLQGKYRV